MWTTTTAILGTVPAAEAQRSTTRPRVAFLGADSPLTTPHCSGFVTGTKGERTIAHGIGPILAGVLVWLAVVSSGHAAAPPNRGSVADAVVASADLSYQTSFVINCSEATWRKVLDNPWLMGQLWNAYGYAPPYAVRATDDGLHIDDPTGLASDLWVTKNEPRERRYFAVGRLTFRAVPFFNSGQAVTIVRSEAVGQQIRGTMHVYIRADRAISRTALWAGHRLVQRKVEDRIQANLHAGVRLVEQIASSPDTVLKELRSPAAETFRAVFLPPKPPPPPTPTKAPKAPRPAPRR